MRNPARDRVVPYGDASTVQQTQHAPLRNATHATSSAGWWMRWSGLGGEGRLHTREAELVVGDRVVADPIKADVSARARPAGRLRGQPVIKIRRSPGRNHHRALTHASPRLLSVPLAQDDAPLSLRVPCPVMLAHAAATVAADSTVVAIRDCSGESFGRGGARRRPVGRRARATPAWPERFGRLVPWLRLAVGAWFGGRCAVRRARSERDARRMPRAQAGQARVQVGRAGGTLAVVRLHVDGVLFPRELD